VRLSEVGGRGGWAEGGGGTLITFCARHHRLGLSMGYGRYVSQARIYKRDTIFCFVSEQPRCQEWECGNADAEPSCHTAVWWLEWMTPDSLPSLLQGCAIHQRFNQKSYLYCLELKDTFL